MKNSPAHSRFEKLLTETFPYQLPAWFSKIIARWAWCILFAVIVVQPWIGWGYWDDAHAHGAGALNFFFYLSFLVMAAEMALQLLALPKVRLLKQQGWNLLYISAFLNPIYGIIRIFSTEGSIGPLFGMVFISAIFLYILFQIKPSFDE